MKYNLSKQEKDVIARLNLPFSIDEDLSDDEELAVLEALLCRFGTDSKESYEAVYQSMAEQAEKA